MTCRKLVSAFLFIPVLLAFAVFDLISSGPSQEIGWEECLLNDLFCVEWDAKPELNLCRRVGISPWYVTGHPGRLSLLPSTGRELSAGQSAVMLCG